MYYTFSVSPTPVYFYFCIFYLVGGPNVCQIKLKFDSMALSYTRKFKTTDLVRVMFAWADSIANASSTITTISATANTATTHTTSTNARIDRRDFELYYSFPIPIPLSSFLQEPIGTIKDLPNSIVTIKFI